MCDRKKRFMDHISRVKEYLKRILPQPSRLLPALFIQNGLSTLPQARAYGWAERTPICALSSQAAQIKILKQNWLYQIGEITVTYYCFNCHHLNPYPRCFQHDLSLITGPNLPQLTNPQNTNNQGHWPHRTSFWKHLVPWWALWSNRATSPLPKLQEPAHHHWLCANLTWWGSSFFQGGILFDLMKLGILK